MEQRDFKDLLGMLNSQSTLFLMDQKILKPYAVPGTMTYSKYRTKIIRDQSGNEVMRIDYDPTTGSSGKGLLGKLQQMAVGLLNFKVGDLDGNYLYSVRADSFMTTTHHFHIFDGEESDEKYSAVHKMMNLAKESLVVSSNDGTPVLTTEYRGYRKFIELKDGSGVPVGELHAPIVSMRDRWQLNFNGDCDRSLALVMVAIMSELGQR